MACEFFNRIWGTDCVYVKAYGQPDTVAIGTSGFFGGHPTFSETLAPADGFLTLPDVLRNVSLLIYKDDDNWAVWPMCSFDRVSNNVITRANDSTVDTYVGEMFDGDIVSVIHVPFSTSLAQFISQKGAINTTDVLTGVVNIALLGGTTQIVTGSADSNISLPVDAASEYSYLMHGVGVDILPTGTGVVTVTPPAGVTLNGGSNPIVIPRFTRKTLVEYWSDNWALT